ncbi:MAG TPA: DNA repair protein RecO [Acholeplasmataceae bacterium]|jgi:DNA repair protein RecO (recombination protein O)|nr:DNA repair protein RecO [Acholeplasmataceae bacterium]
MKLIEGIILKGVKYQENHKLVTVLTPEGLESLLVRGALNQKSKTFAYSQELTKIEYDCVAKDENALHIMTTGKVVSNYSVIKSNIDILNDALLLVELCEQLGGHIEDSATFYRFCADILDRMNTAEASPYYLLIFKLKCLYLLGVGPVFTSCVSCGSRENLVGFAFTSGGVKCESCRQPGDSFSAAEVVRIARFLYLTKLPDLTPEVLSQLPDRKPIVEFVDRYYEHYLGYRSRAARVINKMRE